MFKFLILAGIALVTMLWVRRTFKLNFKWAMITAAFPLIGAILAYYFFRGATNLFIVTVRDIIGIIVFLAIAIAVMIGLGRMRSKPSS